MDWLPYALASWRLKGFLLFFSRLKTALASWSMEMHQGRSMKNQFLRDLALVMPCHGSFDMKPQNVKIVEVSMRSTELRNCWLRTCQRHSLRKINMGIMSIDLCIFGGYNNQLFGSWDYNQLSSWTTIFRW